MSEAIRYRAAESGDVGYVVSSWLKSAGDAWATLKHSDASQWGEGVQVGWFGDVPHRFTRTAVVEILERDTTRTIVACDPEDESVIYGYAVAEPAHRIVHWVNVKHALRRNGVARELVTRALPDWQTRGAVCTYVGRGFLGWMRRYPVAFRPHAGRS